MTAKEDLLEYAANRHVHKLRECFSAPYEESKDRADIGALREATCRNVVKSSYFEIKPLDFDQSVNPPAADSLRWYGRT